MLLIKSEQSLSQSYSITVCYSPLFYSFSLLSIDRSYSLCMGASNYLMFCNINISPFVPGEITWLFLFLSDTGFFKLLCRALRISVVYIFLYPNEECDNNLALVLSLSLSTGDFCTPVRLSEGLWVLILDLDGVIQQLLLVWICTFLRALLL